MKKIFLIGSLAFLAGCQGEIDPVTRGQAYFAGYGCNRCHRVGDNGGGTYGPDLTFIGFRKSPEWLDLWLTNPHAWKKNTPMPNFNLTDTARKNLVAYLSSLKGQDFDTAGRPWDTEELKDNPVERGKLIFDRVGCVGCHGKGGKGGYPNNNVVGGLIPSLLLVSDGYSREELKARIHDGKVSDKADPSGSTPMIEMPQWGKVLQDDELEALVEYLVSIRPVKAAGEEW